MAGHIADAGNLHWCTPENIRDATWETFDGPPDLDPASNQWSIISAHRELTLPAADGLVDPWETPAVPEPRIFSNPPFGRTIMHRSTRVVYTPKAFKKILAGPDAPSEDDFRKTTIADWVKRYAEAAGHRIALIPAATGTKHWQRHVLGRAAAVCWHEGRIYFKVPPAVCDHEDCHLMAVFAKPDPEDEDEQLRYCPTHKAKTPGKWHPIEGPAPMDCAIVLWTDDMLYRIRFKHAFSKLGHVTVDP